MLQYKVRGRNPQRARRDGDARQGVHVASDCGAADDAVGRTRPGFGGADASPVDDGLHTRHLCAADVSVLGVVRLDDDRVRGTSGTEPATRSASTVAKTPENAVSLTPPR